MSEYTSFEKEVIIRSKKLCFDGSTPFVGLYTSDLELNNDYFKILFNSLMHKIISYKQASVLTYEQYAVVFSEHIKEKKLCGVGSNFYYDGELVLQVRKERYKGVMRKLLIPCDNAIVKEDAIRLKVWRAKKINIKLYKYFYGIYYVLRS